MIGWNAVYFGFEWLVVPFVFVYDLGAQAAYNFFDGLLMGAGSDECDHLCNATFKTNVYSLAVGHLEEDALRFRK